MGSKKLKNKLVRVERTINIYKQDNELVEEINIDNITLAELKSIVPPKEGDPVLYDGYVLNAKQIERFNYFISNKIVGDFVLYFYVLECTGIYDWDKNEQKPQ